MLHLQQKTWPCVAIILDKHIMFLATIELILGFSYFIRSIISSATAPGSADKGGIIVMTVKGGSEAVETSHHWPLTGLQLSLK